MIGLPLVIFSSKYSIATRYIERNTAFIVLINVSFIENESRYEIFYYMLHYGQQRAS